MANYKMCDNLILCISAKFLVKLNALKVEILYYQCTFMCLQKSIINIYSVHIVAVPPPSYEINSNVENICSLISIM